MCTYTDQYKSYNEKEIKRAHLGSVVILFKRQFVNLRHYQHPL